MRKKKKDKEEIQQKELLLYIVGTIYQIKF